MEEITISESFSEDDTNILEKIEKRDFESYDLLKLKVEAEKILAGKLCRCIKKIGINDEARSIGICTKTIFNRKGYTRGKFTCKGKRRVAFRKINSGNKSKTMKRK